MYSVGDKVVHPMHGAGTIEEIKEIEIVGKKRQYYVLKFAIGNMVTNVPIENSEEIGIRPVIKRHFNIFVTRSLKMTRIGINVREIILLRLSREIFIKCFWY